MRPQLKRRLRMAAIDFLNPAPLMWDFEHEPERTGLLDRYDINYTTPSRCAAQLSTGEADIGLVPVAAYANDPTLRIVPGCAIASLGEVRSILLVLRSQPGITGVRRVAADTSSLTSFAYTQILFQRLWKVKPQYVQHPPQLDAMLAVADAALLIGDPALLALEDRQARAQRTGESLLYLDLAHQWHTLTGLPWVSAFWAVGPRALGETGARAADIITELQLSRDHGLAHIQTLVEEWSTRIAVPAETIRFYLTNNIHYHLDEACLHGLDLFYRYAEECGALPGVKPIAML